MYFFDSQKFLIEYHYLYYNILHVHDQKLQKQISKIPKSSL